MRQEMIISLLLKNLKEAQQVLDQLVPASQPIAARCPRREHSQGRHVDDGADSTRRIRKYNLRCRPDPLR